MNNSNNKRGLLARLKTLVNSQSFHSPAPKGPVKGQSSPDKHIDYSTFRGRIDVSKWKILDARKLGVTSSMISDPSLIVLKLLRSKGFESYLVGGCVRDLLLNRTPKDFDVITTAKLMEVRKQLRHSARAEVVGRRFPICLVHIKGSLVEVTSFETVAQTSNGKEHFLFPMLPKWGNKEDLLRCKNSLRRDFTINSLFYDPFANKIYDYTNGIADLRSLKLETVIPAHLSFEEDPGRILRGFRIAARLGLSLSSDTETAIRTYSSLVKSLDKNKIMIELNYMLSYGAAEPSLQLLWKFKLLEFLFPLHAAYLDEHVSKEDAHPSNMLMKLFFHLDNLVACDRPCDCTLWIGLLSFHLALVNNPQDALVVWAFASVLYHGEWEEGVKFAKDRAEMCVSFAPEIRTPNSYESDKKIAKAVTKLASLVMRSIPALSENNSLQSMSRYPSFERSGLVFVPRKTGKLVSAIFKMLANDAELYKSERRKNSKINYDRLRRGDLSETRFVLGKIVLETMSSGIVCGREDSEAEKCHLKTEDTKETGQLQHTDVVNHQLVARNDEIQAYSTPNPESRQEKNKRQKFVENRCIAEEKIGPGNHELFEKDERKEPIEEHHKPVKLNQVFDLSKTKDSPPKKKSYQRKQLKNDGKEITNTNKSSLDQTRHVEMDEHNNVRHYKRIITIANKNDNKDMDTKTTNESELKKKKVHVSLIEVFKGKERQKPHRKK
ncbi:hypothetical protein RJT34_06102 [Clitoria ternatea]|uniref:Polynucleotide adenylyltransferase n=1 Tax=Clitoria ternatea TaxID=43366 RepID=A0AAN9K3F8_CLITE